MDYEHYSKHIKPDGNDIWTDSKQSGGKRKIRKIQISVDNTTYDKYIAEAAKITSNKNYDIINQFFEKYIDGPALVNGSTISSNTALKIVAYIEQVKKLQNDLITLFIKAKLVGTKPIIIDDYLIYAVKNNKLNISAYNLVMDYANNCNNKYYDIKKLTELANLNAKGIQHMASSLKQPSKPMKGGCDCGM